MIFQRRDLVSNSIHEPYIQYLALNLPAEDECYFYVYKDRVEAHVEMSNIDELQAMRIGKVLACASWQQQRLASGYETATWGEPLFITLATKEDTR